MPPLPIPRGPEVHFLSERLQLRQLEASVFFKVSQIWGKENPEPEKSGNEHGLHSAASHTPRNMSTAILLRLLSLSSMRDSWIGACEETKGLYHDGAGTQQNGRVLHRVFRLYYDRRAPVTK